MVGRQLGTSAGRASACDQRGVELRGESNLFLPVALSTTLGQLVVDAAGAITRI